MRITAAHFCEKRAARFRYTGQAALPELALYHDKARVYDPRLGRFLQTDPIGYEDDLNLYAYVGNDPGNKSDPSGRFAFLFPLIGRAVQCALDPKCRLGVSLIFLQLTRKPVTITVGPEIPDTTTSEQSGSAKPSDEDQSSAENGSDAREHDRSRTNACREACIQIYIDDKDRLAGSGGDYSVRLQRCIRECEAKEIERDSEDRPEVPMEPDEERPGEERRRPKKRIGIIEFQAAYVR